MIKNWRQGLEFSARNKVSKALESGHLSRPKKCELCGDTPKPSQVKSKNGKTRKRPKIFAHHWNGYNNPLDVWWICQSCNLKLRGQKYHSGQVTKEEAKKIVAPKEHVPATQCKAIGLDGKRCNRLVSRGNYCFAHKLDFGIEFE